MLTKIYHDLQDRYRLSKLDELDWITRNRLIMKPHLQKAAIISGKEQKTILFCSTTSWERGALEHMLAHALKLRGHNVIILTCDGGLPSCSMESIKSPRPSCEQCFSRSRDLLNVFGLEKNMVPISSHLAPHSIEKVFESTKNLTVEELIELKHKDIPVGYLANRDLPQYFFRTVVADPVEKIKYLRKAIRSMMLLAEAYESVIKSISPDVAVVTSGKTTSFSPFFHICKQLKQDVITWDEGGYDRNSFIFSLNTPAMDFELQDRWEMFRDIPLTNGESHYLDHCLGRTSRGDVGTTTYYKPTEGQAPIDVKNELQLANKKVVLLLGNVTWDTSCLDRDVMFSSMMDWMIETIDHFKEKDDCVVVVRCHPSEGNVPDFIRSDERVSDQLIQHYGTLPEHLRLIPGKSNIKSHAICNVSHAISIYTTFVGLEMAISGRKVITCGLAHFRDKGFTVDPSSKEEYFMAISESFLNNGTSREWVEQAKRYAYFYLNRLNVFFPEFDCDSRQFYEIKSPESYGPGGSRLWDNLCEAIIHSKPLVEINPSSLQLDRNT